MCELRSVTPATRRQVWCDAAKARICWVRHTSYTSHPLFIIRNQMTISAGRARSIGARRGAYELGGFAVTGVTGVTRR